MGETTDKITSANDADDSDYDTVSSRTPLRKKACFAPLPQDLESGKRPAISSSPADTNSSSSSPSSLAQRLKQKISTAIPDTTIPEKPREYKLRAFVAFLFLTVVFLVGFAYIFYYQQLLKKAYFERIRFIPEERLMRVFDDAGLEAVKIHMGTTFGKGEKSYPCHEKDVPPNSTLCLEWMSRSRFSLSHISGQNHDDKLRCYRVLWQSLAADVHHTDCIDMHGSYWYGAGAVLGRHYDFSGWPMNKVDVPMSPFVTGSEVRGNNGWGPVLRRYFLSSKAAAILVDDMVPLWISVNYNQSQKLCLQARGNTYPFYNHGEDVVPVKSSKKSRNIYSVLNYTICTSTDMETLQASLADSTMWDGLRQDEMEVVRKLMEDPIWRFQPKPDDNKTVEALMKYTNDIVGVEWTSPGYLLIDVPWEEQPGDLEFDPNRFEGLNKALDIIHRKGFKVAVTIRPFVSTFSSTYKTGLEFEFPRAKQSMGGAWIVQPYGEGAPALTSFNGDHSMALADVTSAEVSTWLSNLMKELVVKHELDGFFIESATVDHLPRYYITNDFLPDPSLLSMLFVNAARQVTNVIGVTSATEMPRLPTFVAIPWLPSSWEGINTLLPLALTLGMIGYPFLIPPPIGGFINTTNMENSLPERELYIRWLQVNMFLPVVQFAILPSVYDAEVERIANQLTTLRTSTVLPLLQEYGGNSMINGLPIIRPLWMLDPFDKHVLEIDDEFCIGDELLVAPILHKNHLEREIYLPKGVWKDGIDGSLRKGGRWIHHYKVKLDQIAHFTRMPEGTRL